MKNSIRKIVLPLLVFLAGLLVVQGMGWIGKPDPNDERQFSQKVNLAMRQATDRLLDLAGDTTSTIPPVEQIAATQEYLLRLENNFNYDSLPSFLAAAFVQFGIQEKYFVTVNDCLNNLLMLGYSQETLKDGQQPCGGRDQKAGCFNLSVVFPDRAKKGSGNGWVWVGLLMVTGLAFATPHLFKPLNNSPLQAVESKAEVASSSLVRIGNTQFDPVNLFVIIGGIRQQLTFREAKLLHFFVQRPNQVLERDTILAAVWEDEGVIVGRSLDVFVSRLRKILQNDPALKIANVHGVGYRMDVGA